MVTLQQDGLTLRLHEPDAAGGFYRGTRFDWAGVFDAILYRGENLSAPWYERYDPYLHDAVCGPAEEFTPVGFGEGETFLKIGVGLLRRPDAAPYDRFRCYPLADAGQRTLQAGPDSATFGHRMDGWYDYTKTIRLTAAGFAIEHCFLAHRPISAELYNHHFFTMGSLQVGPARELSFPFVPEGVWRAAYDSVALTPDGLRFSRALRPGESVYMGNLHAAGASVSPYRFCLRDTGTGLSVTAGGSLPFTHAVFWANHRVACLEPYQRMDLRAGDTFRSTLSYTLSSVAG